MKINIVSVLFFFFSISWLGAHASAPEKYKASLTPNQPIL